MRGTHNSSGKGSSILKTTTWGALIALTAAILVAGLPGFNPWTHSGDVSHPSVQVAEQVQPLVAHSTTPARQDSTLSGVSGRSISVQGKSAQAEAGVAQVAVSPAASFENPIRPVQTEPRHENAPKNDTDLPSTSASPNNDQPAVVAKIAPDLKGVDPEAPVEVIVQYRNAAGAADVAADGATAKAELPLVHAQLVTVRGGNLATLAAHSSVAYISPNRPVKGSLDHVVTAVNADLAYASGWDGTGVG